MGIFGLICLGYAAYLFCKSQRALRDNVLVLRARRKKQARVAVLIPARDESAVIAGLLEDLKKQTAPIMMRDIYVIVEDLNDPTVAICEEAGVQVILRKTLARQRKGYALDEAIHEILGRFEEYDVYFVFDADNRLEPDYIERMLKIYRKGYDMATGYRKPKNGNQNAVTAVSALTFTMINVMSNHKRVRHGANVVFSGTGLFVSGDLVKEWQGWPFHGLTEDYEMSLYATLYGVPTYYYEDATFYDEQPTRYKETVKQRVRWIKGYFEARKKYVPLLKVKGECKNRGSVTREIVGVKPAIWAIIGVVALILDGLIWLIAFGKAAWIPVLVIGMLLLVYIVLMVITLVMIRREKMEFWPGIKFLAVIYNPIYLASYVPCAIKALLKREVTWQKIEHGETKVK